MAEQTIETPAVDTSNIEVTAKEKSPDSLSKFRTEAGVLDAEKLAQSYLNLEQEFHRKSQEISEMKEVFDNLTPDEPSVEVSPAQPTTKTPEASEAEIRTFLANPKGFVEALTRKTLEEVGAPLAKQVSTAALHSMHPELKEPAFQKEVSDFVRRLPDDVKRLENTVEGASFLVKLYKDQKAKAGNVTAPSTAPLVGSPSPAGSPTAGRTFSKRAIQNLLRTNKAEYARLEPEIVRAYQEGRVQNDL